jgi:uroporphyrinogen-III synthase
MTLNCPVEEIEQNRLTQRALIFTSAEQLNHLVSRLPQLVRSDSALYTTDLAVRCIEPNVAGQLSSVGLQVINTDLETKEPTLTTLRLDIFDYVLYLRTKTLIFADEIEFVGSSDFFKE